MGKSKAVRRLYNLCFTFFFWLSSPYYFLKLWRRGDWKAGFGQRFGSYNTRLKHALTNRRVLWFHAVSVGEVNICTQLISAIEPYVPNLKIVISTTTTTGMGILNDKLPSYIEKIYYPIDFKRCVRRAFGVIHPSAVVLVEAEIWPNFLWHARDRGTPVFLVNARLSERSFNGYKRFGVVFRRIFASLAGVGVQDEADAEKMRLLGCRPDKVHVVGNMKFDAVPLGEKRHIDAPMMLRSLGVDERAVVLVGGSTHAGEEEVLADIYKRLKQRFPELFLVLVPRHFERGREVGRVLTGKGVNFVYRSEVTSNTKHPPGAVECLLVNSTGELRYFYEVADIIFVGKSLRGKGGQNPIEPGMAAKPIVFGPHMQNFKTVAADFVNNNGAIQVRDESELEEALKRLISNPERRAEMGKMAVEVVRKNRGSVERTVRMIVERLEKK